MLVVLSMVAAGPVLATAADDSLARVKKSGALTICAVDNLLPYSSSDTKNPGYEIKIGNAVAQGLGVSAKHHWSSWDGLIPALTSKRCDAIINGLFITDERKKVVNFSRPYYSSGESILVRKDNTTVKGLQDLKGKKIGVLTGSVTVQVLKDKGLGAEEVLYPDQNTIIIELNNGRIDAGYLEVASSAWALQKDPSLNIKLVKEYVPDERFNVGVAVRKEDGTLLDGINATLDKMMKDGTMEKLLKEYGIPFWPPM
jgi:ABC-type amino acid transport substrate-binding protein